MAPATTPATRAVTAGRAEPDPTAPAVTAGRAEPDCAIAAGAPR
jgi:hypothetical protein